MREGTALNSALTGKHARSQLQLAAFLWQREGSSIVSQEVPRLPLYAPGDTVQVCIVNLRLRGLWQKSLVKTWETHSAGSVEL